MLVFISFFSVFCKSVLDTSILCHGEQWCQFHGFTDSLQSLQLNAIFEFEMYDISMASLCTWKNEAFEACVVMVTLPDRVPVLPVKNYPYPIPDGSATRHSPNFFTYPYQDLSTVLPPYQRYRHNQLLCTCTGSMPVL